MRFSAALGLDLGGLAGEQVCVFAELRDNMGKVELLHQAVLEIVQAIQARIGFRPGRVYLVRDGNPVEVRVRTGLTAGNATEVSGGDLAEGNAVIVGTVAIAAASRPSASGPRLPF